MSSNADVLAQVPLMRDLSPSELASLAAWFREDAYGHDDCIFREGDEAARFWIVKTGQVKIVKAGEVGREIVVEVISPGEVFGGAAMLLPHQPAAAIALSAVTALSLPLDEYKRLLREYPVVGVRILEMLGERMEGHIRMRALAGERVERRIVHVLLKLASKFGEDSGAGVLIRASLTRQDVAELADTTVETSIRVMSRLSKEGLIKTLPGGYVVLLDREALRRLSGGAG
jgi:CRP/FNR family transcriptional regulator, nitrogen oxide reductase regulator